MILTDELVRDFLQYLYDEGYRYLFVVTYTNAVAVSKSKPTFSNEKCLGSAVFYDELFGYEYKLGKAILNNEGHCIDIGEKLNIIDWSTVKVDTKIHVKDRKNDAWVRRYFAYYKNGEVYVYCNGKTSWSAWNDNGLGTTSYKFAEVVDE